MMEIQARVDFVAVFYLKRFFNSRTKRLSTDLVQNSFAELKGAQSTGCWRQQPEHTLLLSTKGRMLCCTAQSLYQIANRTSKQAVLVLCWRRYRHLLHL
jgi:muramidase (phage lysozyme)